MTRRMVSLVYASILMAAFGVGVAAFGPLLPELAKNNGLQMSHMGIIFPALFAGTIPASLLVGFALDRVGANRIVLFSIPILSIAAIGLTFSRSIPILIVLSFFIGVGGGAGVPTMNTLIVRLFGRRSVPAVNVLNVFFGLGAIAGPALVSLGISLFGTGAPTFWLAAVIALGCLPYFVGEARRSTPPGKPSAAAAQSNTAVSGASPSAAASGTTAGTGASSPAGTQNPLDRGAKPAAGALRPVRTGILFRTPLLWLIGVVLFFDVGTEQTLGGWMAVYMQESTTLALATAALVVSGFWIAFTLGRLSGAGLGTRIAARWVLLAALATALLGILTVNFASGHAIPTIVGFFLTGFGLGPVYPTTMALIGTTFASRAGTVIGATAALGTVGGMAIPWLEGVMMGSFGPPGAARLLAVTVAAVAVFSVTAVLSLNPNRLPPELQG